MRKGIFLLLVLSTFYGAGMYRSLPLLILSVAECLLLPGMFLLAIYFRQNLSLKMERKKDFVSLGETYRCPVRMKNTGRFSVGRFLVRGHFRYKGKRRGRIKPLYGGSPRGETKVWLDMTFFHCGMVQVRLEKLKVYDYLTLFSCTKSMHQELELGVFPKERAVQMEFPSLSERESAWMPETAASNAGDAWGEIRQIREYREGDRPKYIHWNLSARTDKMWIREYEKETELFAEMVLDMEGFGELKQPEADAFYELLSSLVLGLLKGMEMVKVYWYDEKAGGMAETSIKDTDTCRDMLFRLYQTDFSGKGSTDAKIFLEEFKNEKEYLFCLDGNLCFYCGKELLYKFSEKELEKEISEKVFYI
ncbi:MAG: DUF58 domain-containing protein [Roseburia sp.]|nr:DUF58 domain-containing protein [Roseburia sp.]